MGTQQILLIVLSVIIVGIAVAVGITMFNQQSFNSNRNACISDMNMFASQALAWYKTPASHGGNGSATPAAGDEAAILEWIGFDSDDNNFDLQTGNGYFAVVVAAATITITAEGNETSVDPELVLTWTSGVSVIDIDTDES